MKVLFIYPNADSQVGFNYGLAHISALLKRAGHRVDLWQFCEKLEPLPSKAVFLDRLRKLSPELVGFSVVTNQWAYAKELAAWVREGSDAPLVCGGIHATATPEAILETGLFDFVFRGESEEAFLEFVERLEAGDDLGEVRNLGLCRHGRIRINPLRPLPDLRALPLKDYDVFDFQRIIDAKDGWVGLMASRGCPFSCSYCLNHQVVALYRKDLRCGFKQLNYIRHFDLDQLLEEITFLIKRYTNIKMFIFDDDLFTFDRTYVAEFCRRYPEISAIPFVVNAHVGFFDRAMARNLAEANCRIVKFGIESGSPRIRKLILNRHMKNEKIVEAIRSAHEYGLHSSVFLMIGLPGETHEDVMATIQLVAEAQPGRFRWSFFFPFPGTRAHDLSVEMGYVDFKKMSDLANFTEASCLDFGFEHNLFLKKVGAVMPWFVNAHSRLPTAGFYADRIARILELDESAWGREAREVRKQDEAISQEFVRQGLSHYAIKYNPFMGVISDYFVEED
jgi:radical SAM superfamily enzyme YgiQ (UPF0313 family)